MASELKLQPFDARNLICEERTTLSNGAQCIEEALWYAG